MCPIDLVKQELMRRRRVQKRIGVRAMRGRRLEKFLEQTWDKQIFKMFNIKITRDYSPYYQSGKYVRVPR